MIYASEKAASDSFTDSENRLKVLSFSLVAG
jgi:hypothetical protein